MPRLEKNKRRQKQQGFSLIELLVATAILLVIMAGVFRQVSRLQQFSTSQEMRRDMFANSRQLLDQFDRDLRSSGYPNVKNFRTAGISGGNYSFANTAVPEANFNIAAKTLVQASDTLIMFEGDMDGNGIVDSVAYQYVATAPNGVTATCPCILRAEVPKVAGDPATGQATLNNLNVVLENVQAPAGNNDKVFIYYDLNGNQVSPGAGLVYTAGGSNTQTIATIRMVKFTIKARSQYIDPLTKNYALTTLTKISQLRNHY